MRLLFVVLAIVLSLPALAAGKAGKVARPLELTRSEEYFSRAMERERRRYDEQANRGFTEYMQGYTPSAEYQRQFSAAHQAYLDVIDKAMSPYVYMTALSKVYEEQLTEQDLDELIAFYSTPLGQKALHANRMAYEQAREKETARIERTVQSAYKVYSDRFREIAVSCNCHKVKKN